MDKNEEIEVLKMFINNYDNNITILSKKRAKSIFPNYTGENPDFIIQNKTDYIGIDLFELVSTQNKGTLMSVEENKLGIKNLHHLKSRRKELGTKLLYENEELLKVAVERINDKVLNKIKNYVTDKIWLLGYANKEFNFKLLDTAIEDYTNEFIQKYLLSNIVYNERIKNIFLFQCLGNYKLINVIPQAL
ncbi:MAG: hypothetical protein IH949_11880 [Bacteroidetes bacterium]|nr:hypothetical protein [Bacteroidota bacterium]